MPRSSMWTMCAVIALHLFLLAQPSPAEIQGLRIVGLGSPPDSVVRYTDYCETTGNYTSSPTFARWTFNQPLLGDAERDLDLLLSATFAEDASTIVLDTELAKLVRTLDVHTDNLFTEAGTSDFTDLQLVFNYFSDSDEYDPDDGFEVFPTCTEIDITERNHVDVYLYKWGYPSQPNHCMLSNGRLEYGDKDVGQHPSPFVSMVEDPPYLYIHADSLEYAKNSVGVTDGRGKCQGDTTWVRYVSDGVAHEFTHMIDFSNYSTHGIRDDIGAAFVELFPSAASVIVKPHIGGIGEDDIPYGQSLITMFIDTTFLCRTVGATAPCPSIAGLVEEDCRTRYATFALWTSYLSHRFGELPYDEHPVYGWIRARDEEQKLAPDMCGLADVFDGDQFSDLGGTAPNPGEFRLREVFSDFGVAKWVDSDSLDSVYDFGGYVSPGGSFGLFQKLDGGTGPYGDAHLNCWEIAIPPKHLMDAAHEAMWRTVPAYGTDCPDGGWNDPTNNDFCENEYCHPVEVSLWGSDYIVFVADTTYYAGDDLTVTLDWSGDGMAEGTELRVSVLEYGCVRDALYLFGDELDDINEYQYGPGQTGATYRFHQFGEGGAESVVVVLSLVQTDYERSEEECGPGYVEWCMQRTTANHIDLAYSYSFQAKKTLPGGGCPFIDVLGSSGWVTDNNVLAGALFGSDESDMYVLEENPAIVGGTYRLRLTEPFEELSHFDSVELFAIDHPVDVEVCILPDGEIAAYRRGAGPVSCRGEDGRDLLDLVLASDGRTAIVAPGASMEVSYETEATRAGGGAGGRGSPGQKIEPPPGRAVVGSDAELDLTDLCLRANACTSVRPIPRDAAVEDGVICFRLTSPVEYFVDELFLTEFPADPLHTQPCFLLDATHSVSGECAGGIISNDGDRVDLAPGETIELTFRAPKLDPAMTRSFVLVTEGNYEREAGRPAPSGTDVVAYQGVLGAYPNPFNPSTIIRFEVPSLGGRTTVRVYNIAGRVVRELGNEELSPGIYELEWNGRDEGGERVASGIYFYRVYAPGVIDQKTMVLLK